MSDLISRQAVIEAIEEMSFTMSKCLTVDECHGMNRAKQLILEQIKLLPSTGEETRTGRWRDTITAGINETVCLVCLYSGFHHLNYFPHCGAKMKGV